MTVASATGAPPAAVCAVSRLPVSIAKAAGPGRQPGVPCRLASVNSRAFVPNSGGRAPPRSIGVVGAQVLAMKGSSSSFLTSLLDPFGPRRFRADPPEIPRIDTRHNPVNAFTMGGIARDAGLKPDEFRKLL